MHVLVKGCDEFSIENAAPNTVHGLQYNYRRYMKRKSTIAKELMVALDHTDPM